MDSPGGRVVIFLLMSNVAFSLREPLSAFSGRQLLVGYWGQNGAGPAHGPANYEKPLIEVCKTTKYDILAVSFVVVFFDSRNKGLPALNFAYHCEDSVSPEYPFLLRCPNIEGGIKECQKRGKKVLMSIGGATGDGTLHSADKARKFARTLFDLFLGGNGYKAIRPFGSAIMNGIDLDIEGGDYKYYPEFITELRMLMDNDPQRSYLITGAPQCPFPDHHLGPQNPGTGLEEAGHLVDHLYIQFYNNYCHTGDEKQFMGSIKKWLKFSKRMKPRGPLIFVGLPASTRGANGAHYYRPPAELKKMFQSVKNLEGIGGIMLWDVSWDQNNVIGGQRYSEYAFQELGRVTLPPTQGTTPPLSSQSPPVTVTSHSNLSPITTQAPPLTTTEEPPKPTGEFCVSVSDGIYQNPSDCSKFIQCFRGKSFHTSCASGLLFNPKIKACDWPQNVNCA
ncbi:acidic endochitinase SE2-like isoform X2 [Acropora millepora]|uniref:acidic endochitinase SE2-like isoform X2 n=1 Tax=Acropora millepora TaxID=45264 RepID=UPI001CF2A041|nr:acidic endochitinase SE2-like isoform X2 [Acropora millepora]